MQDIGFLGQLLNSALFSQSNPRQQKTNEHDCINTTFFPPTDRGLDFETNLRPTFDIKCQHLKGRWVLETANKSNNISYQAKARLWTSLKSSVICSLHSLKKEALTFTLVREEEGGVWVKSLPREEQKVPWPSVSVTTLFSKGSLTSTTLLSAQRTLQSRNYHFCFTLKATVMQDSFLFENTRLLAGKDKVKSKSTHLQKPCAQFVGLESAAQEGPVGIYHNALQRSNNLSLHS